MAASDQTYRQQHTLDIVFAVTSTLMLVSIVLMFAQDYYRPFKVEQRDFRDVETAIAQRQAIAQIPKKEEFDKLEAAVDKAKKDRKTDEIAETKRKMAENQPHKERADAAYQDKKASYDSLVSFYNIDVDHYGRDHADNKYKSKIDELTAELAKAKATRDEFDENLKDLQRKLTALEGPLTNAESKWKQLNDKFETQVKLAINKQWRFTDTIRDLPVIDPFAPVIKIQQYVIDDIPINFNFKYVKRFDRCTTCHMGIDRPAYSKETLASLTKDVSPEQQKELDSARERLNQRKATLSPAEAANIPDPNQLTLRTLPASELTPARIKEYCAHPRQDLFVGANSKHPVEKFGCTSCHQGQGAATTFTGSFHTPNSAELRKEWKKEYGYGTDTHTFLWDFPMLPARFVESSCLKCHHQVTDLYGVANRNEAPRLLKGYNLLRENGCFGCHEIQGRKGGRQIGPDMRLESIPPLDELTPSEQTKIKADVDNMPGNLRKVGPSLYRLSEKTNLAWTAKWLKGPRNFRPDTKMPHFYGLANNDPEVLPYAQKEFPETEIQVITHYLFGASDAYLSDLAELHKDGKAAADQARLDDLLAKPKLTDEEKKELPKVRARVRMRQAPLLKDQASGYKGDAAKGRQLFSERGCLACHSHKGTEAAPLTKTLDASFAPKVISEAQFGPNLGQLVAKLGKPGDAESARTWLIQWILDPHVHSPRSRMPVTHLTPDQAADVAAWLLSQKAIDLGESWDQVSVAEVGLEKLKKLAEVYFVRLLPAAAMKKFLDGEKIDKTMVDDLPVDEQKLAEGVSADSLKHYLGKKAVGRLGCFACHDIPGFDSAKPIGVGLMDWGKKDPERLAFEDIASYLKNHYEVVPTLKDKDGKPDPKFLEAIKSKKTPYDEFFADALTGHEKTREGFLYQKLNEPRSYDYNRILAWDDRSRMPQFRFARSRVKEGETHEQYKARRELDEADAREAVMTFILGLVAEPVPLKSVNEPTGDRLAEVKGRQVLDKFNCAGCHLVQPGVFDFKVDKAAGILLDKSLALASSVDHKFPNHYNFAGTNPASADRLIASGIEPQLKLLKRKSLLEDKELDPDVDEGDADALKVLYLRLAHALRFHSPEANGDLRDITASNFIRIPIQDMLYPPPAVFASKDAMHAKFGDIGTFGGTFSNLLVDYLVAKDKGKSTPLFVLDPQGDSNYARAAGPPSLVGQGEKTQSAWLYQFLLNPQQIRRLTVLRMPKFNMSPEDAHALVAYFAAVSRLLNTGTRIEYPNQVIPEEQPLDSPYWKAKNAAYLSRLKSAKGADGKTLYEQRKEQLQPLWEGKLDKQMAASKDRIATAQKAVDEAKEALKGTEGKKEAEAKALLAGKEKLLADAKENESSWKLESWLLDNSGKERDPETARKAWEENDAYLADAYKLVTKICLECHQVGKVPSQKIFNTQGPPLHGVFNRIEPGWAKHWIAAPPRMLPYSTVMPVNFPVDKTQYQELLAGSSLDQVIAARDLLMVLPRIEALPVNRFWALSLPGMTAPEKK